MMRMRYLPLALALLAPPTPAWAHHSYAAVDMSARATVQGTVRTFQWTNPHVWVWIEAPVATGATAVYAFESLSPSELTRFFGWHKRVLIPAQPVTIEYMPFRNGDHGGALVTVTFADGRVLRGRPSSPALRKEPR